jgi:hypothetical protein
MDFHAAVTASQVLSSTLSALNNVRDLARDSSDHELKEKISETYDGLLSLKEKMLAMDDEIRDLKARLSKKESIVGPVRPFGYVYKTEDPTHQYPLCPQCYQKDGIISYLTAPRLFSGGSRRQCNSCTFTCWEKPINDTPQRFGPVDDGSWQ